MCEDIREQGKGVHWGCIAITCSNSKFKNHIENETLKLSRAGLLPSFDHLIVIDDPQSSLVKNQRPSCSVGSGGATLNALLIVAEKLSSLAGNTTITSDVLQKNLILLVHFGRHSYHFGGGNAFLPVTPSNSWIPPSLYIPTSPTLLEHSIWMASFLASGSSGGVWITSLDFFLPFKSSLVAPGTHSFEGALVCSLDINDLVDTSNAHGFLTCDSERKIFEINYKKANLNSYSECDSRIVCCPTFFSASLAESFLSLHTLPPLDRCTYYGTDTSTEPIQVSLYFDILLPLLSLTDEERYLSGDLSSSYSNCLNFKTLPYGEGRIARQHIWNKLRRHSAYEYQLNVPNTVYLNPDRPFSSTLEHVLDSCHKGNSENSVKNSNNRDVVNFNSLVKCEIQSNTDLVYISNCYLDSQVTLNIGGDCLLSNFQCEDSFLWKTGSRVVWQYWTVKASVGIITCHGFDDPMTVDRRSEGFTLFNKPWDEFSFRVNLIPEEIWDEANCQTLAKAKIFSSSLSFFEQLTIMHYLLGLNPELDTVSEVQNVIHKWKLSARISFEEIFSIFNVNCLIRDTSIIARLKYQIKSTCDLMVSPSLVPSFKYVTAISSHHSLDLIHFFHEVLKECSSSSSSRLLANVADILGCWAGPQGGLRSGPAGNKKWTPALSALKDGQYAKAINMFLSICVESVKTERPEELIRASRHYERASHIMISKQVETTRYEVAPIFEQLWSGTPTGKWVEATCPARLDLAGGWTDTPPICYELGGAVLNVAIKVNGKRPIGAKARIAEELCIVCILIDASGNEQKLVWRELAELKDYDNPLASGALVKACLFYTKFVELDDETKTLTEQLKTRYNGGLELFVWSELAQGSGLGGSSLLAGTILSVLFVVMGFSPPSTRQLIHATLGVEQLLTTGGGWQDQVGGLVGGIKLGVSFPRIPLVVNTFCIPVDEDLLDSLNQRLLLVYTGKVRLARNLLQTVLRNWYAGEESITTSFFRLRRLALRASESVLNKDLSELGKCIDEYWDLKKSVASGCEPEKVRQFMNHISPSMLGQSLAGAGGGGYLYGLTRDPGPFTHKNLSTEIEGMKSDTVEIDTEGLIVSVGGERVMQAGLDGEDLTLDVNKRILDTFLQN